MGVAGKRGALSDLDGQLRLILDFSHLEVVLLPSEEGGKKGKKRSAGGTIHQASRRPTRKRFTKDDFSMRTRRNIKEQKRGQGGGTCWS